MNTNYNVIKSESDNAKQYYNIFITMENQENMTYDNITVELIDEWDIPTRQYYDFHPNEKKTFIFEDFPLAGGNTHEVTVKYYPSNTSLQSSANSGTTSFSVSYDPGTSSETPFINPIFLIFSLLVVSIIIRRKNLGI
jgi:hypothetical protein